MTTCAICQDDLREETADNTEDKDTDRTVTCSSYARCRSARCDRPPCDAHRFHFECLRRWDERCRRELVPSTCPTCRCAFRERHDRLPAWFVAMLDETTTHSVFRRDGYYEGSRDTEQTLGDPP